MERKPAFEEKRQESTFDHDFVKDVFVLDEFSGPVFEHLTKGDK